MDLDGLSLLWLGCLSLLVLWVLIVCFRKYSDWRISKNRKKYFELNKEACTKSKKRGNGLLKSYKLYADYRESFDLNRVIECSSSVAAGSRQDPVKYLLKYSDIDKSAVDMERLEYMAKFMNDYELFIEEMENTKNIIRKNLPLFYRIFTDRDKLPYTICELNYNLAYIRKPFLQFLYVSPAGRSRIENKIVIDEEMIDKMVNEIGESITKKGHIGRQRSIMTNDLREAIKSRDNYTCCECGNSVYDEPNLLLEVDHIVPVSKGGKTEASNLQTLCWRCNRQKSNK